MPRLRRYALLLGLLPVAAPPAHASPVPGAPFEICRLEGEGASYPSRAVKVPAGTEYDQDVDRNENYVPNPSAPAPPLRLATTAAVSIPADGFCVTAPVKWLGSANATAAHHRTDHMFFPGGDWRSFSANDPLNVTYGYWQPSGE